MTYSSLTHTHSPIHETPCQTKAPVGREALLAAKAKTQLSSPLAASDAAQLDRNSHTSSGRSILPAKSQDLPVLSLEPAAGFSRTRRLALEGLIQGHLPQTKAEWKSEGWAQKGTTGRQECGE